MSENEQNGQNAFQNPNYYGTKNNFRDSRYSEENPMHQENRDTSVTRETDAARETTVSRKPMRGLYVPPKSQVRMKMYVFTKKLEAKQRQQDIRSSGQSVHRPKLGHGLVLSYIVGEQHFQQRNNHEKKKVDSVNLSRKSTRSERIPSEQFQTPLQPVQLIDIHEASNRKGICEGAYDNGLLISFIYL